MVTAELAVATLAALAFLLTLCSGIQLVVLQLRCVDVASEVARQAARDDDRAVAAARRDAPSGARISVRRDRALVSVTVRLEAHPIGVRAVRVPLAARADVVPEPRRER